MLVLWQFNQAETLKSKSVMTDQEQKVGKNAVAIQSARDTVIQSGITPDDMRKILSALSEQLPTYAAVAREIVDARMADFEQRILSRFAESDSVNPEAFKDPDFQYLLTRAQHAYARRGDQEIGDLLVSMIAERSKLEKPDRLSMSLNSAIEVAATLTENEFAELTICFLLKHTINSPLKKAPLTGFQPTAKHIAPKAFSPSSETMRTI